MGVDHDIQVSLEAAYSVLDEGTREELFTQQMALFEVLCADPTFDAADKFRSSPVMLSLMQKLPAAARDWFVAGLDDLELCFGITRPLPAPPLPQRPRRALPVRPRPLPVDA